MKLLYLAGAAASLLPSTSALPQGPFERLASFPVFLNTDVESETVAEIVAASEDGCLLVYTDASTGSLGLVDITDPAAPLPAGSVDLGGEPTSVAVEGDYALVCVNTSVDFVHTSGDLLVVDLKTRDIVATLPLGGQPDAIAVSPDGQYAAICIENERDEDLGSGEPPQAPAGYLVIVDLLGAPDAWTTRHVELVGVPDLYPHDPEPEFVDINEFNVAVVTLQENNHCVLVRLQTGSVLWDFPFGTEDLVEVDTSENDLIEQTSTLTSVPREPDAVTWSSAFTLATADEGDLFGGSRGFTTWSLFGTPLFLAGNTVEHQVARLGHYPEDRSENKGAEPEGIEFGSYATGDYLFVGSERANLVLVYELVGGPLASASAPQLVQTLPTGVGPEGLLALPARDLFIVACEVDDRGGKIRSTVMIYGRTGNSTYPEIQSGDRADGTPIPWGALSGLAVGDTPGTVHTVHDSFYSKSRVFDLELGSGGEPAELVRERPIFDSQGSLLAALHALRARIPGADDFDPAAIVNKDGTVNLDLEGIATTPNGGFYLASEGTGNLVDGVSNPDDRPFESPNLIVGVNAAGEIEEVILPPIRMTLNQFRFGFEGIAHVDNFLYVAFQRAWQRAGDPADRARIGRYDLNTGRWRFVHYPLESPTSPNGGWVGLSEITHLGGADFAVIERDNQGGPDATIKHVTNFSIAGVEFRTESQVANFDVVAKAGVRDLLAQGAYAFTGGPIPEKLEGLTVLPDGTLLSVNDNDGTDDNNGETRLVVLPE